MHFSVTIYYIIISKIRQKIKNSPIVKRSTSQISNIMLDACMQFESYSIETVGEEAYTINSKFQKFEKNSKIVRSSKKSTPQVSDIILDAYMQFENYPIKAVGEEAFYSYFILYHYFKISKIPPKNKK